MGRIRASRGTGRATADRSSSEASRLKVAVASFTRPLRALAPKLPLLALLALVFTFYLWTASSSGNPFRFGTDAPDFYNLQSDAYLHGQVSLLFEPPKGLLALPNPYDPVANRPYQYDLSLYDGRLYLPWGPTPAVTLFIPFRVLPGDLPENLAVAVYSFVGLIFSILLLRLLLRRYVPSTPAWLEIVAVAGLAFGNVAPFILRRPVVYEVAISAGYCFMFAGLYFLCSGALAERASLWRLTLGSLCVGLAVGARPDLLLGGLALVFIWLWLARRKPLRAVRVRSAAALFGPLLLCVVALLLYNYARFHSPLEFGQKYQLAGVEVRKKDTFNPSYVLPGLYFYLIAPARIGLDFPYFHLPPPPNYPGKLPPGYDGIEVTGGVLTNLPIVLLLVAVLILGLAGRLKSQRELFRVIVCLTLLGTLIVGVLSYSFWGTTMRYEVDFVTFLLLTAMLAWSTLLWYVRGSRVAYRLLAAGGTALVLYGVVFGIAISMTGYYDSLRTGQPNYDSLRTGQPETYRALERFFSPLPTLATMILGRPVLVNVLNATGYSAPVHYGTAGAGPATFAMGGEPTTIKVVSPRDDMIGLEAMLRRGPSATAGSRLAVVATSRDKDGSWSRAVQDRVARIPVAVRRGLNEIQLRAVETPSEKTPDRLAQIIVVEGLHATAVGGEPARRP
jgi:hypothetical protein